MGTANAAVSGNPWKRSGGNCNVNCNVRKDGNRSAPAEVETPSSCAISSPIPQVVGEIHLRPTGVEDLDGGCAEQACPTRQSENLSNQTLGLFGTISTWSAIPIPAYLLEAGTWCTGLESSGDCS